MGDDDWVKPQIGIASSWNEITPCNLSLDRLAKAARQGVFDAGGTLADDKVREQLRAFVQGFADFSRRR